MMGPSMQLPRCGILGGRVTFRCRFRDVCNVGYRDQLLVNFAEAFARYPQMRNIPMLICKLVGFDNSKGINPAR